MHIHRNSVSLAATLYVIVVILDHQPYWVWWGWDFAPAPPGDEKVVCLFVLCLFVRHALELQSFLCLVLPLTLTYVQPHKQLTQKGCRSRFQNYWHWYILVDKIAEYIESVSVGMVSVSAVCLKVRSRALRWQSGSQPAISQWRCKWDAVMTGLLWL